MEWDKKEMKKAVLEDPSFKEKSVQERQDLAKEIDALFVQCTDEERKKLTPLMVLERLEYSSTMVHPMLTSSQSGSFSQSGPSPSDTGLFCGDCHIM